MIAELKRENQIDGVIAVSSALILLGLLMIDSSASAVMAISGLIVYAIYKFTRKK